MSVNNLLLLFSSNMTPAYEQDILNVLAAPEGSEYEFRYRAKYLSEAALRDWGQPEIDHVDVMVHFSLQQESHFHEPAFIPIRVGTVVKTQIIGEFHFVRFVVGKHISLRSPGPNAVNVGSWAAPVHEYRRFLDSHNVERPYVASASFVPDFTNAPESPVDRSADQTVLFQRSTEFLGRTNSFRDARFLFVRALTTKNGASVVAEAGTFPLNGGTAYELGIIQSQPRPVEQPAPFEVTTDDQIVRVIGRKGFDIGSQYDRLVLPLYAVSPAFNDESEANIAVHPAPGIQGPFVRLRLVVRPPTGKRIAASGVASAFVLGAGAPGAYPDPVKIAIVVLIAIVAFIATFRGVGKLPTFGQG